MGIETVSQLSFGSGFLVSAAETFFSLVLALLNRFHISKNQFQVNGFNIPHRIYGTIHMDDVVIVKAPDNMNNCVHFPDVGKEFVSQALAAAGAFHQACDIHKFNGGGSNLLRMIHIREHVQPVVRYKHHACIGFDGAERIVFSLRSRVCDRIEKRAFSDVRKTHNSEFHIFGYSPYK